MPNCGAEHHGQALAKHAYCHTWHHFQRCVQDGRRRPFVQSFFLAAQERGFYVLNDVFR